MYRIVCSDGTVLYDQSDVNTTYYITEAKCTREVGQPGSLSFAIVPGSNGYSSLESMVTYLSAYEDSEEIFYGRIIDINVEKTTGEMSVQCAGALNFLDDVEVGPFNEAQNMTCRAFLEYCINAYNAEIGNDSKRTITIGTVDHSMASTTRSFQITSYTKVRSAIDTYLINDFGGFVRVRKSGNSHVLDWIEDYDEPNTSPIQLQNNVVTQENAVTANELYTVLRPTGKNGITLTEGTVALSNDLVTKYGRIVRNVSFNNAETESDLRAEVTDYIAKIGKGTGKTATVNVLDLHFLDNTVQRLRLGAVYSNIAGFENELMMIASYDQNFMSPAEDTITLKNERELSCGKSGSASGRGSFSKTSDGVFRNIYNHITETQDSLSIHAKEIALNGVHIQETAREFERYAISTTDAIQGIQGDISKMYGTGVYQNSDSITQVAGTFRVKYYRVPVSRLSGKNPHDCGYYEFHDQGHTVQEGEVGSGIELYVSALAAMNGDAIPSSTLVVGQTYGAMLHSNDTVVTDLNKPYYTRSLGLDSGSDFTMNEDGVSFTAGELKTTVEDTETRVTTIEGSTLWVQRSNITAVTGQMHIEQDLTTQEEKLVIDAGGGLFITDNQTEFGVYHNGNLNAGVVANMVNDTPSVFIYADHIKMSSASGANTVDVEIDGVIRDLNAQRARIGTLEADKIDASYINATNISGLFVGATAFHADRINTDYLKISNAIFLNGSNGSIITTSLGTDSIILDGSSPFTNCIISASVNAQTNTLTLTPAKGDPITFSKAIAPTLSGSWSSGILTVTSNPAAVDNYQITLAKGTVTWDGNIATVPVNYTWGSSGQYSGSTGWSPTVDASARYNAGYSSGHTDGVNSVTIYSISQQAEASYSSSTGNYSVGVTATASNGVSDTDTIIFSGYRAYNAGWSGCYGTIEIDPSTATTLDYGGSVTVKAKAKASSSDTSKTEVATVTVTAPAAPTLSGSWSSGVFTVSTSPSTSSLTTSLSGSGHWGVAANSEDVNTYYLSILGAVGSGTASATGYTRNIDASGRYDAGWNSGFADGAPTGATLGTKVTGTTWNVNIARGSYSAVGKTINLSNAYTDARSGYYTKAQYDANYTSGWSGCYGTVGISPTAQQNLGYGGSVTVYAQAKASSGASSKTNVASVKVTAPANNWQNGFDAGAPTGATLGTKVTGTTWNVNIARGSYSAVGKTINLSNAYTDARSGYYTKAQYDANYNAGWNAYRTALLASGKASGYTHLYYGSWYGTLYVAPTGGANPVYNCVGQATGFDIPDAK